MDQKRRLNIILLMRSVTANKKGMNRKDQNHQKKDDHTKSRYKK
jgi:hypothetical protein